VVLPRPGTFGTYTKLETGSLLLGFELGGSGGCAILGDGIGRICDRGMSTIEIQKGRTREELPGAGMEEWRRSIRAKGAFLAEASRWARVP
jgi:hypothetical protein